MEPEQLKRTIVIGSSCAGKTTFARNLAHILDSKHIELDAINWLPGWQQRPDDEFRELVKGEVASESWVLDGNYSRAQDITWPRATAVVWLDFSFPLVFYRVVRRTTRRVYARETLFSGNKESFRNAFLSGDSMIVWVVRTYRRRRRECAEKLEKHRRKNLEFLIFQKPSEAEDFLRRIETQN
ncbi:MAG: hypothetical protein R2747_13440 [Pyrinomonadaceae bacterium]